MTGYLEASRREWFDMDSDLMMSLLAFRAFCCRWVGGEAVEPESLELRTRQHISCQRRGSPPRFLGQGQYQVSSNPPEIVDRTLQHPRARIMLVSPAFPRTGRHLTCDVVHAPAISSRTGHARIKHLSRAGATPTSGTKRTAVLLEDGSSARVVGIDALHAARLEP